MYKKVGMVILVLAVGAVMLGGCSSQPSSPSETSNTATQKQGDTTKTGVISQSGSQFFLQEAGQPIPEQIESYSIDLSQYVGQTVTVTGQFSGDTLFVGSVE